MGMEKIAFLLQPPHSLLMHDPRIDALAEQLITYSVDLQAGEKVLIELFDVPESVGVALIRKAREIGGVPFIRLHSARIAREVLLGATDDYYETHARQLLTEMEQMQAYIAIRGSYNTAETSDVSSEQNQLSMSHLRPVLDHRVKKTKWCVLRWPHPAMAQQASMSTEAFEDFYFDVCLHDYSSLLPGMNALKALMDRTDQVQLLGTDTDLSFSIKDIPAIVCAGNYNLPDGEVFSAPVKDSVNGVITHNAPTVYRGIHFDGIRLVFENGKITEATAAGGKTKELNDILDSDDGARFVGEFAIAMNPVIKEPMRDILFDEKIDGSFHFTPGQAYEEADNGNRSQVHWDMVSIQRPDYGGGQIIFDGEVIRQDGKFLPADLLCLNP